MFRFSNVFRFERVYEFHTKVQRMQATKANGTGLVSAIFDVNIREDKRK